ncbi:MAG: ATPase domain-containing protein [Candidatus Bathyarchaeota archaeon]
MNIEKKRNMDRVPFGIDELDKVIGGGLPRNSLILLSGNAGTGKTILSTQFLHNGVAQYDEKGIYVSFAEDKVDYFQNMEKLGIDMRSLEEKNLFKFMDFATMDEAGMKKAVEMVFDTVFNFGAKRLVIDSLSALLQTFGLSEARIFLHSVLSRLVKGMGVTAIVIGEMPYGENKTEFGVEEFIADGVIRLRHILSEKVTQRILEIPKMRGTSLGHTSLEYLIDRRYNGLGFIVLPTRPAREITVESAPTDKLNTGIEGLDAMLSGGVFRSSVTLVEGAPGIGKTTLCLYFLLNNAEKGEKALFVSFEEPVGQITRMLQGLGVEFEQLKEKFRIQAFIPEAMSPLHYYRMLKDIIDLFQPTVLGIDSVSAIQHTFPEVGFIEFMRYFQLLCKEKNLTAFLTSTLRMQQTESHSGISALADNIILMRYRELKDKLLREILILKTRGSAHEKRVLSFDITDKGLIIHPRRA